MKPKVYKFPERIKKLRKGDISDPSQVETTESCAPLKSVIWKGLPAILGQKDEVFKFRDWPPNCG